MFDNSLDSNRMVKVDKYLGALLGAAVGDALGWPNEQNSRRVNKAVSTKKDYFQQWSRRCGGRFWAHEEEINQGEYSDDTQLIIATARSLRYGSNWSRHFTKVEIPAWPSYERGGGGATKRAAEVWKKGGIPWKLESNKVEDVKSYFSAGGNGVAMRILPHVFYNEDSTDEVMHQVILNGIYTHGHPRALLGATLYADALICIARQSGTLAYGEIVDLLLEREQKWSQFPRIQKLEEWLINADHILKKNYMEIWESVVEETVVLLNIAKQGLKLGALDMGNDVLEKLGCFDKKVNGAGTVTAVTAIYLFSKYASNPHMGLIEAANLISADTDTLASMVGGLLGMLHGTEWLSSTWLGIQDYTFFKKMIPNVNPDDKKLPAQAPLLDSTNYSFKNRLKDVNVGDTLLALPFNVLTVIEKKINKPIAKGISVHTIKLKSEEGQTIFLKTFEKSPEKSTTSTNEKNRKSPVQLKLETETKDANTEVSSESKSPDLNNKEVSNTTQDKVDNAQVNRNQVLINANKLRSFANVLPENMPTDQYLFFISDVMLEIERGGTGNLDNKTLFILKERWKKFSIELKSIEKIIKILLNY